MKLIKVLYLFIIHIFAIVGLVAVGFGAYMYIVDPFGLVGALLHQSARVERSSDSQAPVDNADSAYDHPLLTDKQEDMVRKIGIDPQQIPEEITPEMQACLMSNIGKDRAMELLGGASPTGVEIVKIGSCL